MYHEIPAPILALIEPMAGDHGLEIVDASIHRGQGRTQVRVFVDTPGGDGQVTIDACAALHRELAHGLPALAELGSDLALEVSSPGIDRVLGREIDFERAVGRTVALETRTALDGRRRFKGELLAFRGERVFLRQESVDFEIPFELIRRARAFHPEPARAKR